MSSIIIVGEYKGYQINFLHISYNCPSLGLWGFRSESAIKRAITKELKK